MECSDGKRKRLPYYNYMEYYKAKIIIDDVPTSNKLITNNITLL